MTLAKASAAAASWSAANAVPSRALVRKPEAIIEAAVKRMLPKNKLAAHVLSKLNVYKGDKHPHQAQKPQDFKLEVREYKPRKVAVS